MTEFEVYMHWEALQKANKHFKKAAKQKQEAIGLLVGMPKKSGEHKYIVIDEYLTSENDSTFVSTEFSEEAFPKLAGQLVEKHGDKIIVGWAHSHPTFGCFLSDTDLRTQKNFFPEWFHAALVIDPVRGEKKFFKLDGYGYREASYAVIKKRG